MTIVFEPIVSSHSSFAAGLPSLRLRSSVAGHGSEFRGQLRMGLRVALPLNGNVDTPIARLQLRASTVVHGTEFRGRLAKHELIARRNTLVPTVSVFNAALPSLSLVVSGHTIVNGDVDTPLVRPRLRASVAAHGAEFRGQMIRPAMLAQTYPEGVDHDSYLLVLQSAGYVTMSAGQSDGRFLADGVYFFGGPQYQATTVIAETLTLSGQFLTIMDALKIVAERLGFSDDLDSFLRVIVNDILTLAATGTNSLSLAIHIVDALSLHVGTDASQEALAFVAAVLALNDAIAQLDKNALTSGLSLTDAMSLDWLAYAKALDAVRLDAAPSNTLLLSVLLSDTVALGGTPINIVELLQRLKDTLGLTATISLGDETYTAWVMNVESSAFSRYEQFPFNSFAKVYESYFGAAADGIYILEGDDDAGEDINARVRWGLANIGQAKLSRVEMAYLGLSTDGTMGLKAITTSPEGDKIAYYYKMNLRPSEDVRENRIKIGKGLQSVYWGWELTNIDGSDFALHDFSLLPMVLSRRIRRE